MVRHRAASEQANIDPDEHLSEDTHKRLVSVAIGKCVAMQKDYKDLTATNLVASMFELR